MSQASVGRQYVVCTYTEEGRVVRKSPMWSYGQAMNTAGVYAGQRPDHIVWLESRVVITESWEDVDYDAEEKRLAAKIAEREAAQEVDA